RRRFVTALRKLSADSDLHPKCFALSGIKQGTHVTGGTFGDVHDGMFEGQKVALKVMRVFNRADFETALKNFSREAIIWRQLSHPNVLPFFGLYYLN
ncbi:hypothetical protein B0H14DRAFT_2421122, partial [Mycena olivaceomarginata]